MSHFGTLGMVFSLGLAASMAQADQVEITLVDDLDGVLNGYCVDIRGGGRNVDPASGLQAHTCYSYQGQLGQDQIFDTEQFDAGTLYMTEFDVCVEAVSLDAGAELGLTDCNAGALQTFDIREDGTLRPAAASDLCITVGDETRHGRNPEHLIRSLFLAECSADQAALQTWRFRSEDD